MNGAISVRGLRKLYGGTVAVDDVSFEIEPGEIFGLIGPNGSGKTTTVECIEGLRRRDAGEIRVLGLDPQTARSELAPRLGCQLQESALPDRMRVWEALDLFASLAPRPADPELLLEQWGLAERRAASYASLSGGQRQRLLVALALVNSPEVVFLDEMTTGLDPAARHVAWRLIEAIRDGGATVVLVTHFMDEAERLCDRIAVLRDGRVVELGTPAGIAGRHGAAARVSFSTEAGHLAWLEHVPGVASVRRRGARVELEGEGPLLALVASALVEHGIAPLDLEGERPSLEHAYLALTGSSEEG
jgi:ABC-2 type transport system ATP-binding protein